MSDYPIGGAAGQAGGSSPMAERMQQLLSRAVEDQLSEQRQLAMVLGDIRAALARIPDEIAVGAGQAAAHQAADLAHLIDGVGARLDLVSSRLGELATGEGLRTVTDRLEVLLSRLDGANGRLDSLGGRLDALGDPAAEVRTRVSPVEARIAATERQISELARSFADTERRIAEHVDEAILALADALLRRRGRGGPGGEAAGPVEIPAANSAPAPAREESPAPADSGESADAEVDLTATEQTAVVPVVAAPGERSPEGFEAALDDDDDFGLGDLDEEVPLPDLDDRALTEIGGPGPVPATAGWIGGDDDDEQRRRRPWWRPGE